MAAPVRSHGSPPARVTACGLSALVAVRGPYGSWTAAVRWMRRSGSMRLPVGWDTFLAGVPGVPPGPKRNPVSCGFRAACPSFTWVVEGRTLDVSDPVVLITGALTGIGRATAFAYARQGANLVVSGRHEGVGGQLAGELADLGAPAEFMRADVRFDADVKDLVDRAVARFGRIDVAFNNAGTEGTPGPVTEVTDEAYQATFDTNVKGTLLCLKHEFRVMREQGGGSIVNVSSTFGLMG
ncbi:SDR family NAD(P)-dependent oxidoreductase [Streptomyces atratus]|uniref:SDR family NAD(P)-dependent oxidoreductase n=1 Tax=Streptomyces atratus TaxID=1893 RepID=UPI00369056BA